MYSPLLFQNWPNLIYSRLVTQTVSSSRQYAGIVDCFTRMLREEGIGSFYNSLTPRLVSGCLFFNVCVPLFDIPSSLQYFIKWNNSTRITKWQQQARHFFWHAFFLFQISVVPQVGIQYAVSVMATALVCCEVERLLTALIQCMFWLILRHMNS